MKRVLVSCDHILELCTHFRETELRKADRTVGPGLTLIYFPIFPQAQLEFTTQF